jgi:hypothetical protein
MESDTHFAGFGFKTGSSRAGGYRSNPSIWAVARMTAFGAKPPPGVPAVLIASSTLLREKPAL